MRLRFVFLLFSLGGLAACQRPFVEVRPPAIEVLAPDLSVVQAQDSIRLQVRASSFRVVQRVQVGSAPMAYNATADAWELSIRLSPGLNRLVVSAYDEGDVVGADTLYALHLAFSVEPGPGLGEPLGGHTATRLADGRVLVTGGARTWRGQAQRSALLFSSSNPRFAALSNLLQAARTGHTATLLPDGRVLIVGGSSQDAPDALDDLVDAAEVFDPLTNTFKSVPVSGPPIRRAGHTALLRTTSVGPVVDLLGGQGDIEYSPPRFGIRRDLSSYLLRNDSLISLTPAPGPFVEAITGHTQIALAEARLGTLARYLITDSYFIDQQIEQTSFVMDYTNPLGVDLLPTETNFTPRTRHAAVLLVDELVVLFGGWQGQPQAVLDDAELYSEEAGRYFRLPIEQGTGRATKRFGHTATKLFPSRILLLGGFSSDGNALGSAEFFIFDL